MSGSPSSKGFMVHTLVVSSVVNSAACSIVWLCTYRLFQGIFQSDPNSTAPSKARKWNELEKVQILGMAICVCFSIGIPLSLIYRVLVTIDDFHLSQVRDDDQGSQSRGTRKSVTIALGASWLILAILAGYMDIYLNILKLDVFDQTTSEVSPSRKRWYRRVHWSILVVSVLWLAFFLGLRISFLIFTLLGFALAVSILGGLAFEFAARLSGFIQVTRKSISMHHSISSRSLSDVACHPGLSAPNLTLLRVVIKHSVLSLTKITSLLIHGVTMLMQWSLIGSPTVRIYTRLGMIQAYVAIPLCVFLSFDFANGEYVALCARIHRRVEDRALGTLHRR